jgi:myo-inositol-1(or 4)-monophosphatase
MDRLSQRLVEIASQAALQVGDILVNASARDVSVEEKSSFHDLVTKYDRESEEIIADYIFKQYPDSTLVGEEDGIRGKGQVQWYVDPIDGTSNFAAGLPFFCVSIGAALNDQPLAGVIYDPIRRELFTASTQGAFLNGEPIRAGGHKTDSLALLLTAFPSPHAGISDGDGLLFAEILRCFATVRRVGSAALALAYVACGRADVVLETSINAWDVAAGMFLVEQAGGRYVPFGSRTSSIGQAPWMFPGFVATCSEFDLEQSIINRFLTQEG